MDMSPLDIPVLKMEKVGRISGSELLQMMNETERKAVCIDVRTPEEFKLGTLSEAMNIPHENAFNPETGTLNAGSEIFNLAKKNGQVIAIMGSSKNADAQNFAEKLLQCQLPRILTLHGGVEVFYGAGVLMVPHA